MIQKTLLSSLITLLLVIGYSAHGQEWRVYDTSTEKLSNVHINAVAVDDSGNKWIATNNGGVVKYKNNNWQVYKPSNSRIISNYVKDIAFGDNAIWFTVSHGFGKFDGKEWTEWVLRNRNYREDHVRAVAITDNNTKWFGSSAIGLTWFRDGRSDYYDEFDSGLPDNWIDCLAVDQNDNLWIGTNGGGLARFDGRDWKTFNTRNSDIPSNDIQAVEVDADNNIWIGTGLSGLIKFKPNNNFWIDWNPGNSELPHHRVNVIAFDNNGNTWAGTDQGGLVRLQNEIIKAVYDTSNSPLPDNEVQGIAVDSAMVKYIGTEKGFAMFGNLPTFSSANLEDKTSITLYPNPTRQQVHIKLSPDHQQTYHYSIKTMDGKTV